LNRFLKTKNKSEIIDIFEIIDALVQDAEVINPGRIETPYCEDPDDVVFLQVAIASHAKYLISGDKHLLKVKAYPSGKIIKPAQFLEIL
jgi:putative PIN family toxin of toxin-antitoxin system